MLGLRPLLPHNKDILLLQNFRGRQIIGYLNGHGESS